MFEESHDALQLAVEADGRYRLEVDARIAAVERRLARKIDADFAWTIDGVVELRETVGYVESDCFHGGTERYKMQLNCDWCYMGELWIYLRIYGDDDLPWPFDRSVTITITDEVDPLERLQAHKMCQVQKPINNNTYLWSAPFEFHYRELGHDRLLLGNRLIVQCVVHDE